ncbi:MAG: HAD-IC family P-type ATPase [Bryobacteraceae bacterium]|nr:HAD-IC family P-type ATPase [Bryobacteraceae bacterium]
MTPSCHAACAPGERLPWLRIGFSAFLAMNAMTLSLAVNLSETTAAERGRLHLAAAILTAAVFALLAGPLLTSAWRALRARRVSIEALFLLGIAGAVGASAMASITGKGAVYYEVAAILLVVYTLGTMAAARAQQRALDALLAVPAPGGAPLHEGARFQVHPGERIPVRARVVAGEAFVEESRLTGEFFANRRSSGDTLPAGAYSLDGLLTLEALEDSRTPSPLLEAIDRARANPASIARTADRFAQLFVPVVSLAAAATFAFWFHRADLPTALLHCMAVLLVACPCAAGFATPAALWSAARGLAARGFLVRDGASIERLACIDTAVFDKTGTLAAVDPALVRAEYVLPEPAALRQLAAAVERASRHPLATAFREVDSGDHVVEALRLLPGRGVEARLADGRTVRLESAGGDAEREVLMTVDNRPAARFFIGERLHPALPEALERLQDQGVQTILATGDAPARAAAAGFPETHPSLDPEAKQDLVRQLQAQGRTVLFLGDGVNDTPALAAAHCGIAVHAGAEAAHELAALVWRGGDPRDIPAAIAYAREARRVTRSNLQLAVAYNIAGIAVAAAGLLHPILAVLLMTCSSLTVTWRALRLLPQEEDAA